MRQPIVSAFSSGLRQLLLAYCISALLIPWQPLLAQNNEEYQRSRAAFARDGLEGFGSFANDADADNEDEQIKLGDYDNSPSEDEDDDEQSDYDDVASSSSSTSSSLTSSSSSSSTSSSSSSSSSSSGSNGGGFTTSTSGRPNPGGGSGSGGGGNSGGGGGSGLNGLSGMQDINFLDGFLGGAVSGILGSLLGGGGGGGLFGGGGGGLFGGGGNFPNGDVQGTPGGLYGNLTDMSKLFPGDPEREVEGEECEEGPNANAKDGELSDRDTQVLAWQGNPREFNRNVGQGVSNALGSNAPAKTYGPGGQGSAQDLYNDLQAAAADKSGKKYVVVFNCHGSPGSPGNWEGGANTQSVYEALQAGNNDDLSHITFVDGACFPCRAPWLATQQMAEGKTPINHVRSGQFQNRVQYFNPTTGNSHTVTNFVGAVQQYLGTQRGKRTLPHRSERIIVRSDGTVVLTKELLMGVASIWAEEWRQYQAALENGRLQETKPLKTLRREARARARF